MREDGIIQWTDLKAAKQNKERRKTGGTDRKVIRRYVVNSLLH